MWKYIGPIDVAKRLGISEESVEEWVRSKKLPPPLVTSQQWWDEEDIKKIAAENGKYDPPA